MKAIDFNLLLSFSKIKREDKQNKINNTFSLSKDEIFNVLINHRYEIERILKKYDLKDEMFNLIVKDKTLEDIIKWHINAWYSSRVNGLSNGFSFNYESEEIIRKFDNILFNNETN